ncbi:hypothetical protein B0H63DRAFT_112172 [Podospora didyma]|uniref:DUF7702 domain-containing protein n=1 Tax=Podospora didyma TaxID=330526 RepID=A0AAE0NZ61_9PEZI|nr:hypothetical protein B0H63DRAFT_112172 [Podospora didyma]
MANSLPTAELAIYAMLSLPILYILFRHGLVGLVGWIYLFMFCAIRLVGGAMSMGDNPPPAASIIANVGLSPLMLAVSGILHEAGVYCQPSLDPKVGWLFVLIFHMVVAGGIGLVASGSSALQGDHPKPSDLSLVKVGMAILTVCWVGLCFSAALSVRMRLRASRAADSVYRAGSILLNAVSASLVFLGVRVIYGLAALCTENPSLSPISGTLVARALLSFLPELASTLMLIAAGVLTRNVSRTATRATVEGKEGSGQQLRVLRE